jgi:hypothetical protein
MVEVVHAHVLTHASPLGSVSDFAILDTLTPRKNADPDKPSNSISEYTVPTWEMIKDQPVRPGSKKSFAQCGSYRDYAVDGE